ncbi:MAG: DUF2333 family protein [bacterium]
MKAAIVDWWDASGKWTLGIVFAVFALVQMFLLFYWSQEPDALEADEMMVKYGVLRDPHITGAALSSSLMFVTTTLLEKPGGFIKNDKMPPGVFMDNMPNWEFGALVQARDLVRALRNDMARSQTQSLEDKDLSQAEPHFNVDANNWLLPMPEKEYALGVKAVNRYLQRLSNPKDPDAQFYARADNLKAWLSVVEKRLGSLSQRLSASVGQARINTDLSGDDVATQSTMAASQVKVKTPWLKIDDVFWEARGSSWALIQFLKAAEIDFAPVLKKKNALISLRQIVRELESTQDTLWSPMVLNGTGFALVANHSLVMASYISRANAAVIDLRQLLEQG